MLSIPCTLLPEDRPLNPKDDSDMNSEGTTTAQYTMHGTVLEYDYQSPAIVPKM